MNGRPLRPADLPNFYASMKFDRSSRTCELKKIKLFKEKNYDTINKRNKGKGISEHESTKEKHAGLFADLD